MLWGVGATVFHRFKSTPSFKSNLFVLLTVRSKKALERGTITKKKI